MPVLKLVPSFYFLIYRIELSFDFELWRCSPSLVLDAAVSLLGADTDGVAEQTQNRGFELDFIRYTYRTGQFIYQ